MIVLKFIGVFLAALVIDFGCYMYGERVHRRNMKALHDRHRTRP